MELEIIFILSGIVQLITLICFFVLCTNVSAIKKRLSNNGLTSQKAYCIYLAMGEKEKAKQALIETIFADETVTNFLNRDADTLKAQLKKYEKRMKEVDLTFDFEKAVEEYKAL